MVMVLRNPGALLAWLFLVVAVTAPPFGMAFGASSMAAGVFCVSLLAVLYWVAYCRNSWSSFFGGIGVRWLVLALTAILVQSALSSLVLDGFDLDRFWKSYILLLICILGAIALIRLVERVSFLQVDFAISYAFYTLLLCGAIGSLRYSPFFDTKKAVFFFSEPSHFSLSFLPLLFYMVVAAPLRIKPIWILVALLLAGALQNLTLLVGVVIITVIALPVRGFLLSIPIALIFITAVDGHYYMDRLDVFRGEGNLSVLVFQQGWERAYLNVRESYGMGVGFQQFGIVGDPGKIAGEVAALYQQLTNTALIGGLNWLDGGSVAPKLIGELGWLGIGVLAIYLRCAARVAMFLRNISHGNFVYFRAKDVFFSACFIAYSIDLFVRGVGYFSPSSLLFLCSLLWGVRARGQIEVRQGFEDCSVDKRNDPEQAR